MQQVVGMKQVVGVLAVVATLVVLTITQTALATPPSGLSSTLIGQGRFVAIDTQAKTGAWQARIRTKRASDLYVLENRFAPGGTIGWHSHPGPSMAIVKAGTATVYAAHDHTCMPHVVKTGDGFVDPGGHVHIVRNEGSDELVLVVTSLVPAGAERRIDEPDPGNCRF